MRAVDATLQLTGRSRRAGQAKKSDCVCPKKPPQQRGKKKSKLPETDEPLEAIESRFLGEDEDQRELEACRERKGALDEEAERLRRELAETRRAQEAAAPAPARRGAETTARERDAGFASTPSRCKLVDRHAGTPSSTRKEEAQEATAEEGF